MKVMAIVAGRHNGNSEILAKEALLACQEAGAECKLVNLFDYHIEACTGCEACSLQMGALMRGEITEYKGCSQKDKDDFDKLINEEQTSDGVIIAVPTYDLAPSSMYTKYAHRCLAYEVAFRLAVGELKKDPCLVGGLIALGGSCHDWQTMSLEVLSASLFTQSIQCVDMLLGIRDARPGNVLLREDQVAAARKMGENIVKAINTPVEERTWLGDPDMGVCPNCHTSLIYPGDPHWDGIEFPFECAVCGAGGDLVKDEATGKLKFVIDPEKGLIRNRYDNKARAEHLNEIMQTTADFFEREDQIKDKYETYKKLKFPAV